MKKIMKTILLFSILVASFSFTTSAFAFDVGTNAIDLNGYEYIHSWNSTGQEVTWTHEHTNPQSVTAAVTYAVSRTKYTTGTFSATSTFSIMQQKVGFTAEVSKGVSVTDTTSITWNLPANSTYLLRYGSRYGQAGGTENYWLNGVLKSSKSVTGKWTYRSFSDSIKQ